MFGHNDNQQPTDPGQPATNDQATSGAPDVTTADGGSVPAADAGQVGTVTPATSSDTDLQLPATPGVPPATDSAVSDSTPSDTAAPASTVPAAPDDLLNIKQDALQQLSPLVGHLDQSPEEKFRTTMMMIQATDDHTKIAEAYEAAKQITDDKIRAQALLDVVNEINYFTQQNHETPQ